MTTAAGPYESFSIGPRRPPDVVIFDADGEKMVTVNTDHTVTLHQPDRVNEAARVFWEAVHLYGVGHCVTTHATDWKTDA